MFTQWGVVLNPLFLQVLSQSKSLPYTIISIIKNQNSIDSYTGIRICLLTFLPSFVLKGYKSSEENKYNQCSQFFRSYMSSEASGTNSNSILVNVEGAKYI